jgi:MFS transporter, OFA family, oxalate/formate antiporter
MGTSLRTSCLRNRSAILLVGFCTLIMFGMLYAWSVFVPPLEQEFGWSRSQTSFTFSVAMVMWSVGMLANGQLSKYVSSRICFVIATICIVSGFALCSTIHSLPQLYIYYGVLTGFGTGMSYNLWTANVVGWYGDKVGFASGILLMGFGMGSMILGSLVSALIYSPVGWRVAFIVLAVLVLIEALVAISFIQVPDAATLALKPKRDTVGANLSGSQIAREPSFWVFVVWRVLTMGIGGAIIAQASVMMTGVGASIAFATIAVGCLGIGNGLGRPLVGIIYDRLGQNKTMVILPACALVISGGLIAGYAMQLPVLLAFFIFLEGMLYGGYAAINTSFVRNTYGQEHLTMNMGISSVTLLPFNVIFPMLAALVFDGTGSYLIFFLVVPMMSTLSLVAGLLIKPSTVNLCVRYKDDSGR